MFISKRTEILNLLIYPRLYKIYTKSQNYSLKMETFTHPFFFNHIPYRIMQSFLK